MMISTRGRYALNVMADLAIHQTDDKYIPMKEVAARQQISLKYLEQILPVLTKNGMVLAMHGKGGGYRLTRKPEEYSIGEILRLTEGDMAPVACVSGENSCLREGCCKTNKFFHGLNDVINTYLDSAKLSDII